MVEIIHATTISNLPQLKKQKGNRPYHLLETPPRVSRGSGPSGGEADFTMSTASA